MRELMERAIRRGWYIFPIEGKQPLCAWRDASARVVPNHPRQTGYGIDTGKSGLIVLDVDGPGGAFALDAFTAEPPRTYSVTTPHGVHYYFKANGIEARNSASQIAGGLDIRAVGGYVVGAGSVVEGQEYAVDQGNLTVPSPVPDWLVEEIQGCQNPVPQLDSKCKGTDTGILLGGGPVSRFIRGETSLGERNHSFHAFFTWTAWNVHLPSDLAWEWWQQLNAELEVPENDIQQVEATMESAYRAPPEDASSPRPVRGTGADDGSYRRIPRDQRVAERVAERRGQ